MEVSFKANGLKSRLNTWFWRVALALISLGPFAAFASASQEWSFRTGAEIFCVPAVDAKNLYFGSYDGNFYCLDKATGKERWRRGGFAGMNSSPIVCGKAIAFSAIGDRVCALQRETGERLWEVHLDGCGLAGPTLHAGRLLIPGRNRIVVLDPLTGRSEATNELSGDCGPICGNSTVICAVVNEELKLNDEAGSGQVVAFQSGSRKPLWTAKLGGACLGNIGCDEARCYVGARDGRFYAIDLVAGKIAWEIDCRKILPAGRQATLDGDPVPELKPRVGADGHVELVQNWVLFTVSHQNIDDSSALVAAERNSGKTVWVAQHQSQICGRFAVAKDWIYAATQDRRVLSIRLSDGKIPLIADMPKADRGEFAGVIVDSGFLFIAGADATVSRMLLDSLGTRSR